MDAQEKLKDLRATDVAKTISSLLRIGIALEILPYARQNWHDFVRPLLFAVGVSYFSTFLLFFIVRPIIEKIAVSMPDGATAKSFQKMILVRLITFLVTYAFVLVIICKSTLLVPTLSTSTVQACTAITISGIIAFLLTIAFYWIRKKLVVNFHQ